MARFLFNIAVAVITLLVFITGAVAQSLNGRSCEIQVRHKLWALEYLAESDIELGADQVEPFPSSFHYEAGDAGCVLLVERRLSFAGTVLDTSYIIDLSTGRELAYYSELGNKVLVCQLTPILGSKTACDSREQFEHLVATVLQRGLPKQTKASLAHNP